MLKKKFFCSFFVGFVINLCDNLHVASFDFALGGRSTSLRLGGMLSSPLEHLNPSKSALANRLQWARSSIRKRLDMNSQRNVAESNHRKVEKKPEECKKGCDEASPLAVDDPPQHGLNGMNGLDEEIVENGKLLSEIEIESGIESPRRRTLTSGDPLGALDAVADDDVASCPDVSISSNFVAPDPSTRLFAVCASEESDEDDDQEPCDDNQTPKLSLR